MELEANSTRIVESRGYEPDAAHEQRRNSHFLITKLVPSCTNFLQNMGSKLSAGGQGPLHRGSKVADIFGERSEESSTVEMLYGGPGRSSSSFKNITQVTERHTSNLSVSFDRQSSSSDGLFIIESCCENHVVHGSSTCMSCNEAMDGKGFEVCHAF